MVRSLHLDRRIVCKECVAAPDNPRNLIGKRLQQRCRPTHPVGHGRAVQIDPFTRIDLALAVEGKMIGVFADQDMRQKAGAGSVAFNWARWQWGLHNRFAARASFARADNPVHDKTVRHILKLFGDIFAKGLQLATAARAVVARRQHFIVPIQMIGQRLADVLARCLVFSRRRLKVRFRCSLGNRLIFLEVRLN